MDAQRALGLWRSTFGAVKIEPDNSKGGLDAGNLQGIWVYQRQGQEVVGYFSGNLRGNVLQFRWQEPDEPPLTGEGYLVFDVQGRQYSGRWWSDKRDRIGDWNGWRQTAMSGTRQPAEAAPDNLSDGSSDQRAPQRRQPYRPQSQPYQPQPYPAQSQPYPAQSQPYPAQPQPYPQSQPYPAQSQPYPAQPQPYPPPSEPR